MNTKNKHGILENKDFWLKVDRELKEIKKQNEMRRHKPWNQKPY